MPIQPPRIDDRNFQDLVQELIARIPAHTPEWSQPRHGDPGRTQLELFAWLADSVLYRANLIPEKQRLTFLKLLGVQMQAAVASRTVINIQNDDAKSTAAITIAPLSKVSGSVNFETRTEVTVLPVNAQVFYKRKLDESEQDDISEVLLGLSDIYKLDETAQPYVTTNAFVSGKVDAEGLDIIQDTIDNSLWVALVASDKNSLEDVRKTLGGEEKNSAESQQKVINIGVMPLINVPPMFDETSTRGKITYTWEISTGREINNVPEYVSLDVLNDGSDGFTKLGVQNLLLPGTTSIGAPDNDVRTSLEAGVGDRPPRIDDPETAEKLVTWLRVRPTMVLENMSISWLGINAVEIDQRETFRGIVIGQSNGSPDQIFSLSRTSIESSTFVLNVEEQGYGYVQWQQIEQLGLADRDDAVFQLDSESGTITFGDGMRGRIPERGMRIRVAVMRAGGGESGNLPENSLTTINPTGLDGSKLTAKFKVLQPLATRGGADAESINDAEKRIPLWLQHRNRAITENDYKALTVETPGVKVGRVEVLPKFLPHQRQQNVPGVVSVMVLPDKSVVQAPNPRPVKPFIEQIYDYLSARRPLATELYVIGCEYIQIGMSVSLGVRKGFGHDEVLNNVKKSLKHYLWSLPPLGPHAAGWPLGKTVSDRELEVTVARVTGVEKVNGVNIFIRKGDDWSMLPRVQSNDPQEVLLKAWQLPELLSVVAIVSEEGAPTELKGVPSPFVKPGSSGSGIAVPVVPEVC